MKLVVHVQHPEFANPKAWSKLYLDCTGTEGDGQIIELAKEALRGITAIRIAREYGVPAQRLQS
jgi:hypothetical protein